MRALTRISFGSPTYTHHGLPTGCSRQQRVNTTRISLTTTAFDIENFVTLTRFGRMPGKALAAHSWFAEGWPLSKLTSRKIRSGKSTFSDYNHLSTALSTVSYSSR